MLRIICAINNTQIDEIQVVNTGHIEDGKNLYRIKSPEKYNYLEIYHDRNKSWHYLAELVLGELNKAGYDQKDELKNKFLLEMFHEEERKKNEKK